MSPKVTFTICSAITFLFSASAYVAPEFFTKMAFPAAEGLALDVGISMRYFMAAAIFVVCCLFFQARNLVRESDQMHILLGGAVGFTIVVATILYVTLVRGVEATIPSIIGTGLVTVLMWFSWAKIKS
jgi:hypothetical protein